MNIMNNPLVSVIIPNYNHARFLDERIQSILNQTYTNIEIIILDDCSTDTSKEVIEKYRNEPKIKKIIYNEQNSGSTFLQWEKGLEQSDAEIIWIAESDDSCDISMLEELMKIYKPGETSVAFCRSLAYKGAPPYAPFPSQNIFNNSFIMDGNAFVSKYMIHDNRISNASSAIFDKKKALDIDKSYMKMKANGDWLFWIEICESGKVAFLNEPLNYFRQHDSNTTKKMLENGNSFIEHKIIYDKLVNNHHISTIKAVILKGWQILGFQMNDRLNMAAKQEVLNTWDPNKVYRTFITPLLRTYTKCRNLLY